MNDKFGYSRSKELSYRIMWFTADYGYANRDRIRPKHDASHSRPIGPVMWTDPHPRGRAPTFPQTAATSRPQNASGHPSDNEIGRSRRGRYICELFYAIGEATIQSPRR